MQQKLFLSGIVEGFYGRQWRWCDRFDYASYLAEMGLNSYLYCPKGDPYLRKQWRQQWPAADLAALSKLSQKCSAVGVNWGVGLSPYQLYLSYGVRERGELKQKIEQINDLNGVLLAILFDDMPGDFDQLAHRQAEIVADISHWSHAERILVCPTYYSFDSQLQHLFGAMPENYWSELGRLLPRQADIFWTGNEVCSAAISVDDVRSISSLLCRAPILWDNYPVNDGAKSSNFLYLKPLANRSETLATVTTGHVCNPMSQPALSLGPLSGLAALYAETVLPWAHYYDGELAARLSRDTPIFQQVGLTGLSADQRLDYKHAYARLDCPAAAEVVEWLDNKYEFDPDCLTD